MSWMKKVLDTLCRGCKMSNRSIWICLISTWRDAVSLINMSLNVLSGISYSMCFCPPNDATLDVSLYPWGANLMLSMCRVRFLRVAVFIIDCPVPMVAVRDTSVRDALSGRSKIHGIEIQVRMFRTSPVIYVLNIVRHHSQKPGRVIFYPLSAHWLPSCSCPLCPAPLLPVPRPCSPLPVNRYVPPSPFPSPSPLTLPDHLWSTPNPLKILMHCRQIFCLKVFLTLSLPSLIYTTIYRRCCWHCSAINEKNWNGDDGLITGPGIISRDTVLLKSWTAVLHLQSLMKRHMYDG